jgi:hypothetical protein
MKMSNDQQKFNGTLQTGFNSNIQNNRKSLIQNVSYLKTKLKL